MPSIQIDVPPELLAALRKTPEEFAIELSRVAAIQWYADGIISQGTAARMAGLTRAEFIDELGRRRVAACQVTLEELREDLASA